VLALHHLRWMGQVSEAGRDASVHTVARKLWVIGGAETIRATTY
jgi:hypothetical protein